MSSISVQVHALLSSWIPHDKDAGFYLLAIGLIAVAFWLAAFQSCISNEHPTDKSKRNWILLILLLGPLGALGYFVIRRPQRIRELGW